MPKHHLIGYDDGEILKNLKFSLASLRRYHPRAFISSNRIVSFYNAHFDEVPVWYLRSFIARPHFSLDEKRGWLNGAP